MPSSAHYRQSKNSTSYCSKARMRHIERQDYSSSFLKTPPYADPQEVEK